MRGILRVAQKNKLFYGGGNVENPWKYFDRPVLKRKKKKILSKFIFSERTGKEPRK